MKALVYDKYCTDNNFESILAIKDIDEPTPKPNERNNHTANQARLNHVERLLHSKAKLNHSKAHRIDERSAIYLALFDDQQSATPHKFSIVLCREEIHAT